MRNVFALSMLGLFLPRPLHAATGWERYSFDQDDLAYVTKHDPEAGRLFLQGEAELAAGATQSAVTSFAKVVARVPESSLAQRRYCEALTEVGERREAILACQSAIEKHPTPPAFRAMAKAQMSGPPTPEQLALATRLALAAARQMSDQPWGDATMSYIAERIGDEKMLATAVAELERIAPGHYETRRAEAALKAFRLSPWAWAAWFGLALAGVATACHAGWTMLSRGRRKRGRTTVILAVSVTLCAAALLCAGRADAAPPAPAPSAEPPLGGLSKWHVDDANPIKSLPTTEQRDRNPLEFGYHMMDLADKADIASRKGDWLSVGKYYEAMSVAVPDRAIGYRKSCDGYEKAGDLVKALQMCRGALGAGGTELYDYTRFAKFMFAKTEPLTPADTEDLSDIVKHLKEQPNTVPAALDIQCELAQQLDDVKRLEDCAAAVAKETPNDPKLVIYQWGIAMKHEDYKQAQGLLDVARQKGLKPAGIEMMEHMTSQQSALGGRIVRGVRRHPGLLLGAFALLAGLGLSLAMRRRLKLPTASAI